MGASEAEEHYEVLLRFCKHLNFMIGGKFVVKTKPRISQVPSYKGKAEMYPDARAPILLGYFAKDYPTLHR